jgi:hypothetical protein
MDTSTFFEADEVEALRDRAVKARAMQSRRDARWVKAEADPMALLAVFDRLRLKPGWVLRAWRISTTFDGGAMVFALPAGAPFPEPQVKPPERRPDFPQGAVGEVMTLIDGDGSPASYLHASLFAREAREFGAEWHALQWSNHVILCRDPRGPFDPEKPWRTVKGLPASFDVPPSAPSEPRPAAPGGAAPPPVGPPKVEGWALAGEWPAEWRPESRQLEDGRTQLRFHVYSEHMFRRIVRVTDTYPPGGTMFSTEEKWIVSAPGGFVY